KIANEQLDHVVNELARFRGGNAGQLFELDLSRLTTMPAIGLFGVGMDTRDDELLTVAQEFDLLWLRVSLYVRSDEIDRDLVERLFGSKKDSAFWRQANTHQNIAAVLVTPANERLGCFRGLFIENVEIERRHQPGEGAGIDRVWPDLRPHVDHLGRDFGELLPISESAVSVVPSLLVL